MVILQTSFQALNLKARQSWGETDVKETHQSLPATILCLRPDAKWQTYSYGSLGYIGIPFISHWLLKRLKSATEIFLRSH